MTMKPEQKNRDFVQFSREYMRSVANLAKENAVAFDVFMFLTQFMDGTNALVISNQALSELVGVSSRTIQRATKYLKDNGWVCIMKSGTSNVYIINPEVAWTSYGDQKSYCRFNSTVVLTPSENPEFLRNPKATTHYRTVDKEFLKNVFEKRSRGEQLDGQLEIVDEDMNVREVI